jgi:hypothetical protein
VAPFVVGADGAWSLVAGLADDLARALALAGTAAIADAAGIARMAGTTAGCGQPR